MAQFPCRLQRQQVPVAVVNARMSPRSLSRYRLLAPLSRRLFGALDLVGTQTEEYMANVLSLGATPRGTFFQVTLPLIRPGVLVGALFAFITSFDELVVALFLSGSGAVTLPRRMWDDLRFQIDPTIAAVSTLTIVLTVALMASAHLLRRRTELMRTTSSSAP